MVACGDDDETESADQDEGAELHGLTREQASQPLATIGETQITVGEFAERLADQSPYLRARFNSPERRREFLENMIRFELLAQEADRRGLDELPDVVRSRNQSMIQQLMREQFEDRIRLEDVTDADVEAFYQAHEDEFHKPPQVRASAVGFADRAAAQRALTAQLAHPEDVEAFRELAASQSDADLAERRGDLGFFGEDGVRGNDQPDVPQAVAIAAFGIERIGGLHGEVVEAADRFWVVKLTGRRPALVRSLEEARRPIQNRIWRERRDQAVEDFVAELRAAADVEVNPSVLESVRIDVTPGAGAAVIPEGTDNLTGSPELRVPENPRTVMPPTPMQPTAMETSMAPTAMHPTAMDAPAAMQPATMAAVQPATMEPATMGAAPVEPTTMEPAQ